MTLRATLEQLPPDYEVVIKARQGTAQYSDLAGDFLEMDGESIYLEDFELVSQVYLPGKNGYPLPEHLRPYRKGDIGGFIDPPDERIMRGPIGDWLTLIEPETEASLASLGAGLIAALGAFIGRRLKLQVGRITHTPNIFVVQVGPTGTARKGTADGEIRHFLETLDRNFAYNNIASGFGSGEALIERVSDPEYDKDDKLKSGTPDQRLYIQESEFSKLLRIADRQGNILSDVIRLAFDANRPLANAAKGSRKLKSSNHCISLFGGITPEELTQLFPALAAVSGTGNRYLWVWSDPDKLLPFGGQPVDITDTTIRVRMNVNPLVRDHKTIGFSDDARQWWETHYPTLRQASHVPENIRPMVTRLSDQIQRIALVYAATEGSQTVTSDHLEAGSAWAQHSTQTVQAILGGLVRNQEAGRILAALRQHPGVPAKKTELHDLFSRHLTGTAMDTALDDLEEAGLAYSWTATSGGGRPPVFVMATTPTTRTENTFFARNDQKEVKPLFETSVADEWWESEKTPGQSNVKVSEKSGIARGGVESDTPNAREVSPEEYPDPW